MFIDFGRKKKQAKIIKFQNFSKTKYYNACSVFSSMQASSESLYFFLKSRLFHSNIRLTKLNILHSGLKKEWKFQCTVQFISKDFIKIHESKSYACTTVIYCTSVPAQLSKNEKKNYDKLHAKRAHNRIPQCNFLLKKISAGKKSLANSMPQ